MNYSMYKLYMWHDLYHHTCTHTHTSSSIDDVILGYLVDVLSTLGEEDSSFDVDQFVEMMTAYIPDISSVDR